MTQPASLIAVAEMPIAHSAQAAAERAAAYAAQAHGPATRRAYKADWQDWQAWADRMGCTALPASPAALGAYLADLAGTRSVATIRRRLAAISTAHRMAGLDLNTRDPAIRDVMRGVRRTHGVAPRQARASTTDLVRDLAGACDNSMIGLRDRALILLGFASAMRRSELAALDLADIEFVEAGIRLTIKRSKADQEGEGAVLGVMGTGTRTCPVAALRNWLDAASISAGRVFRSVTRHGHARASMTGEAVAMAVRRRARQAGLNPTEFSAHSLRSGLITSAAAAGLSEVDIQRQSRHRSVAVLRAYVRPASVFLRNVSGSVGL